MRLRPQLDGSDGEPHGRSATVATVLPLAWPALHRTGGDLLVATQGSALSGDPSRDLAAALLLAAAAPEGTPVTSVPAPTVDDPRLQDVLDTDQPFSVDLHDSFDFWVGDVELDQEGRASLEQADAAITPTTRVDGVTSAYWCVMGSRSYLRWVLPYDEDVATAALARLHAAGAHELTDQTRLLGAFRAGGLLVPVWEVPAGSGAADYTGAAATMEQSLARAAADPAPLTAAERRSRSGLLNRQVTLR